jgi:hypothetical protein
MKFQCPNTNGQSASSFCPETSLLHFVAASKNRSTAIMVKKKELSIDEKPQIQVWTVAGVKTAEICTSGTWRIDDSPSESGAEGAAAGGVATASPPHFWLS